MRLAKSRPPSIGDHWLHRNTDAVYVVVGRSQLKNTLTPGLGPTWIPVVTYRRADGADAREWTRTVGDFARAFTLHSAAAA